MRSIKATLKKDYHSIIFEIALPQESYNPITNHN